MNLYYLADTLSLFYNLRFLDLRLSTKDSRPNVSPTLSTTRRFCGLECEDYICQSPYIDQGGVSNYMFL